MRYGLREGLSFCRVDDGLIFLDLKADRYFRLGSRLEQAFLQHQQGDCHCAADLEALLQRNILVPALTDAVGALETSVTAPSHSLVEHAYVLPHQRQTALMEVLALVCSVQLQLKTRTLDRVLGAMATHRGRSAQKAPERHDQAPDPKMVRAIHQFRRARPYVPIETCCLLDSISLVVFLARHGLWASLVFGVTNRPFAAHCWVQNGDWMLNDTVGNALAHTPIRVI
ncbi:lasso peptide biosynthesis B2 protein [Luteimonas sp. TWI1437]|uniref:lasso peptide biosynthesis B2 protein n=1 Tax=unclassified Luteimonas TaxID=2629088 RepID=UPI003208592E